MSEHVREIRTFTRFYTRLVGVLNEVLLQSPFTLTEARVLFELGSRGEATAAELADDLRLDPAYLSRILRRFGSRNLLTTATGKRDRRERPLRLTDEGRQQFEHLDIASDMEIKPLVDRLSGTERDDVVRAMATIRSAFDARSTTAEGIVIRPYGNGDASWIIHRQALLYADEYGWNRDYEVLITGIVSEFLKNHDPSREQFWVAERNGLILGSIFLVNGGDGIAKLRLLYVEPSARGLGIGRKLVDVCLRYAKQVGYRRMTLWTNDVLVSARRIYQAAGFELVTEERHHSFGKDLVGQTWERAL